MWSGMHPRQRLALKWHAGSLGAAGRHAPTCMEAFVSSTKFAGSHWTLQEWGLGSYPGHLIMIRSSIQESHHEIRPSGFCSFWSARRLAVACHSSDCSDSRSSTPRRCGVLYHDARGPQGSLYVRYSERSWINCMHPERQQPPAILQVAMRARKDVPLLPVLTVLTEDVCWNTCLRENLFSSRSTWSTRVSLIN